MKVLHLIDSLDYGGSSRQLRLLGPALARQGVAVEVCCLGPLRAWGAALRDAGVTVHALNWSRWFDPEVLWRLREILRGCVPDLIHVWRLPALRTLALVARHLLQRVVMSAPLPPQGGMAWWDRWLLQRVRCLAVGGISEQQGCLHLGLVTPSLRVVSPAVAKPDAAPAPSALAEHSIVCIGKLERQEGFRQAIWAFDIILQCYPEAQLHVVGTGSQHQALLALAQGLRNIDHVQFLGEQADVAGLLQAADVVWIPSTANCGRQVALEAMAQGRPVIASDVPSLRDVIIEGETGYLVPVGEVVPMARRTHGLFRDAILRDRLGQAARKHVEQRFSLAEAARRWHEIYRSVAA